MRARYSAPLPLLPSASRVRKPVPPFVRGKREMSDRLEELEIRRRLADVYWNNLPTQLRQKCSIYNLREALKPVLDEASVLLATPHTTSGQEPKP